MATRFNTGKIRFSYPSVFRKNTKNRDEKDAKYELTVVIPKDDKETVKRISEACKEVFEENKNSVFKGLTYDEVAKPYHDGDGRKPKGGAYSDDFKGCYLINARTDKPPVVVDRDRRPVTDERMVYPGCYGRVNLNFYPYNVNGNRGIAAGLNGVQTYNYGAPFGNAFTADGFDDGFEDPDENTTDDLI